ncbi:MAG: endonuclease III domain-containing protein [bacterium]|jgi:endonuclease-3
MKNNINIQKLKTIYEILDKEIHNSLKDAPINELIKIKKTNKWISIFATILSSRTTDKMLIKVLKQLSKFIKDPYDVINTDYNKLLETLKPLGFYKTKAKYLFNFSKRIIQDYNLEIPNNINEITKLPGIGIKVGAIILNNLYNLPIVGVDIHVHRILNRLGIIKTKNEKETFKVINSVKENDIKNNLNHYLVALGQVICKNKPKCNICFLKKHCNYYKIKKENNL